MTQQQNNDNNLNQENQEMIDDGKITHINNDEIIKEQLVLIEELTLKVNEFEKKNSELNDKLLRTLAEFDNFRRRSREDLEKASKFAISNFVNELVVIVENFLMASENAPQAEIEKNPAIKNYATAISLTEKELLKILEKNQVKRIFPMNEQFDHNFHEAVSSIESEEQEGVIIQVIQAGYVISNRLIRPALVVVSKAKNSA